MVTTVCLLAAACLLLATSTAYHWRTTAWGSASTRLVIQGFGVLLLLAALSRFVGQYGWEVGIAWFLLCSGLTAGFATAWMSWRPRTAVWMGSIFVATALTTWAL